MQGKILTVEAHLPPHKYFFFARPSPCAPASRSRNWHNFMLQSAWGIILMGIHCEWCIRVGVRIAKTMLWKTYLPQQFTCVCILQCACIYYLVRALWRNGHISSNSISLYFRAHSHTPYGTPTERNDPKQNILMAEERITLPIAAFHCEVPRSSKTVPTDRRRASKKVR